MKNAQREKFAHLREIIKKYNSVVLAFSGGKDSALVLYTGAEVLGTEKILAVTAVSPIRRAEEIELALEFSQKLKVNHQLVYTKEFLHPDFINKPKERCLICKDELFSHLERLREKMGFQNIADGTNFDDIKENRPVFAISEKYGVKWPLVEAKVATSDVESLLLSLKLKEFVRPHYSCSASKLGRKRLLEYQKRESFKLRKVKVDNKLL
jgi:uncharacterized protein